MGCILTEMGGTRGDSGGGQVGRRRARECVGSDARFPRANLLSSTITHSASDSDTAAGHTTTIGAT